MWQEREQHKNVSTSSKEKEKEKGKEVVNEEHARKQAICSGANAAIKSIRLAATKARLEKTSFADASAKFEKEESERKLLEAGKKQTADGDFYAGKK